MCCVSLRCVCGMVSGLDAATAAVDGNLLFVVLDDRCETTV